VNNSTLIHVSRNNSKLGKVYNLSLPPVITCEPGVTCAKLCYAMKFYRLWPSVRDAWNANFVAWSQYPSEFCDEVIRVSRRIPEGPSGLRLFRWHVGGDIPSQEYFRMMCEVAENCPDVKYLAYTKRTSLDFSEKPGNLTVVLSHFPGFSPRNPENLPTAHVFHPDSVGIPRNAFPCGSAGEKCDTCAVCWRLQANQAVAFKLH